MSDFPFKVGDKITRRPFSKAHEWFQIEWHRGELIAGFDQNGDEDWWRTCHVAEWRLWVAPVTKEWKVVTEWRESVEGEPFLAECGDLRVLVHGGPGDSKHCPRRPFGNHHVIVGVASA